jgi:hypothetical protein
MTTTRIRGNKQIQDGTIEDAQIASAAAIALSKLAEAVLQADGGQAMTGDLPAGGHAITGLADPTNAQDAATKAWVLANSAGPTTSATVRAATTANITLSGTQTVDGVALSVADTVLVKAQTLPKNNGLYAVASGAWTRLAGMDAWAEVPGVIVSVEEGGQADTLWLSTADAGGTLGTTDITFIQLPGPSDLLAGAGLTRTGQTVDVVAGDNSLVVNANELHVKLDANGGVELGSSAGLDVKLDGGTLGKGSAGVKVASGGVTGTELASSVAGDGLAGGGGSALSVNVDGSTIETNADALRVKDAGITAAKLGANARRVVRETPTGAVDGANTSYTLANTPTAGSEEVYLNGILQESGAGTDYTISGGTITYLTAPGTGDRLRVSYMH